MPLFEGTEFSTITDEMSSKKWEKNKFLSDWETQFRENNDLYEDKEIQIMKKIVIEGFYESYELLLELLEDEDITTETKENIKRKINLAMMNILEYGQRTSKNIMLSLKDKQLPRSFAIADIINPIIDNLIIEVEKADKEFNKACEAQKKNQFIN